MVISNGVPCDGYFPKGTEDAAWKAGALGTKEGDGCGVLCGIDNSKSSPGPPQVVNWSLVGHPAGAYDKGQTVRQTYNFADDGESLYKKTEVRSEYGSKVKPAWLGLAMMAITAFLLLLLLIHPGSSTLTSTTTSFKLATGKSCLGVGGLLDREEQDCCRVYSLRCSSQSPENDSQAPPTSAPPQPQAPQQPTATSPQL